MTDTPATAQVTTKTAGQSKILKGAAVVVLLGVLQAVQAVMSAKGFDIRSDWPSLFTAVSTSIVGVLIGLFRAAAADLVTGIPWLDASNPKPAEPPAPPSGP